MFNSNLFNTNDPRPLNRIGEEYKLSIFKEAAGLALCPLAAPHDILADSITGVLFINNLQGAVETEDLGCMTIRCVFSATSFIHLSLQNLRERLRRDWRPWRELLMRTVSSAAAPQPT